MFTLCDHSEVKTYRIKLDEERHFDYEVCNRCGLSPDTPPITSMHPGELEPWWEWKPVSGAKITRERPGINRVQNLRTMARDQVYLLQELIALEAELGDTPDPALAEELREAQEYRASLGYVFVSNV